MALIVFVVSLFGMLFLGVPIFMSIGASGLILYAYGMGDMEPILLVQRMFNGLNALPCWQSHCLCLPVRS